MLCILHSILYTLDPLLWTARSLLSALLPCLCNVGFPFESLLGPCWIILGSFWGPCWLILVPFWGHFGVTWGGTPYPSPPQRRGSILGPPFGTILGSIWGPLWDPLGTHGDPKRPIRDPKALPRGVSRGVQNETPKMTPFWTPLGGAQVSSRLHESTVFTISPDSLLDPILAPFWDPFGTQEGHYFHQGGPRGARRGSERGSQKGILF